MLYDIEMKYWLVGVEKQNFVVYSVFGVE